ncbi:MAG: hypothetical protein V2I33_03985 [Kangiellaceae bacterium]|nr:hypothetical protein [Kangiellaceae bacterium]
MKKSTPTPIQSLTHQTIMKASVNVGKKVNPIITENAWIYNRVQRFIFENFPMHFNNPDNCDHIATPKYPKCAKCSKKVVYN